MTDIMTAQEARDRYGPAFDQAIRDVAALENDSEKMALLLARFGRAGNQVAVAITLATQGDTPKSKKPRP